MCKYYTHDLTISGDYFDEGRNKCLKSICLVAYEEHGEHDFLSNDRYWFLLDLRVCENREPFFTDKPLLIDFEKTLGYLINPVSVSSDLLRPSTPEEIELFKQEFNKRWSSD